MKDILNQPLEVDDRVVTTVSGYEELQIRFIHSFTPKMVRLSTLRGRPPCDRKTPRQLVKVS